MPGGPVSPLHGVIISVAVAELDRNHQLPHCNIVKLTDVARADPELVVATARG